MLFENKNGTNKTPRTSVCGIKGDFGQHFLIDLTFEMIILPETVRDTAPLYVVPAELVAPHRYVPPSEVCELVMTSEGERCKIHTTWHIA